jgi:glycosyltransferase involved in cell wall biosynthesis
MLAARRAKLPYLLTFHGGGHSFRLRNSVRGTQLALLRPLLTHAERLVTLAHFEEAYYTAKLHLSAECFALIPNGADLPKPVDWSRQKNNGTLIASVGRLEHYKGHQRIIAALPAILKQKPDVFLWIAGKGSYESTLRSLAMNLGVEDHVRFQAIPPENREEMARELASASLVVLLSKYETHPIAILEALALGCPALVADTSGLSELCEQGLARGIPLDSTPDQVAAAVIEQLRSPMIPDKIDLPSWDDCAEGLLNLYYEVSKVNH